MKKKWIALLLAGVLALTPVLSGCSSGDGESSSSASGEAPAQELTVAVASQIFTLDPALNSTTHLNHPIFAANPTLFYKNEKGELVNDLCKEYTISDDGLTYTFTLIDGVKWSDGQPLTANDFVYGIKRAIGYGPDNTFNASNLTNFVKGAAAANESMLDVAQMDNVGVYAPDDKTLVIELSTPCPYFLSVTEAGVFMPLRPDFAKEHESTWSLQPGYPTVGAFQLESVNENEQATFVKNPSYYKADEVKLEKLQFLVMTDENAQLAAFKSGQIGIALGVPSDTATNSAFQDNFLKLEYYTCPYFVAINSGEKGPEALKDARVRKALALATNRDAMVTVLNGGDFITPLNGYVPYGFPGLNGDFRTEKNDYLAYNPEESKRLLEEAGYNESNPLQLTYLYSSSQLHGDVAQMLQQQWAAVGVDLKLQAVEMGVFYDYVDYGDFELSRYGFSNSSDPLAYFKIWKSSEQAVAAVDDPKLDEMIDDAYNTVDHTEYLNKLHDIETYMLEEQCYLIPLFVQEPVKLVQTNVKGVWANPGGRLTFTGAEITA
ncbi:peptide ABC transporter substrate-binding protein [Merdimmobilis hominis]|uniref:peptide ABC transporter substrate-binding protein n=2 Tax=Merdimmobilis hominis TaxID=2897707 RepID=UPI0008F837B6|nr:peptide ABC transporter substrate-binding protein [Merdimmobilis hominis]